MRHVNRTVGVLFLAASSVYAAQASGRSGPDGSDPALPVDASVPAAVGPATQPGAMPVGPGLFGAPDAAEPIPIDVGEKKGAPLREGQPVKAGQVNVSEAGTVEIHVVDANLLEVLRMLAAQSQRNIIASKEVRGAVTANLYDVTIKEALDAILQSNGFAYREKGNFIYVYTVKELQEIERASRRTQTEVFRLFYTPAANAVNMVKPVLSADAQVSFTTPAVAGITGGTAEVGGNSHATDDMLVVTDYPENLDKIREVLKEVDRRPQQILIEATILRASLTEDNALGVDFNILAGVNFNNILTTGNSGQFTGAPLTSPQSADMISRGAGQIGTGNNFTQGINNGLRVGFVSDNISVFIAALEGVTDTTVLANPKILALNKQKGEVVVGRKDGYLTTTVTSSSSTQTVEFLETGTRLIFRPFIGDDGYVRMEIHPEDSSGGLTANANLPFKITTEVTSNIMVKDGRTVVIGGLFRESTDSSKNQVPLLGNIPLAGNLFKNQRDRTAREEIIILLTPHIIKDEEGYSRESLAAQKDFEKLRVGVRQGMMSTGRERLAEISYEKAVAEMAKDKPDRSKALWHLDIATNLNPKFSEAIALKEKLTGVETSSVDNSSIRGFVRRRMMAESNVPAQPTPRSTRIPEPKAEAPAKPTGAETAAPAATDDTLTVLPPAGDTSRPRRSAEAAPATRPAAAEATAPSTRPAVIVEDLTPQSVPPSTRPATADAGSSERSVVELPPDAPSENSPAAPTEMLEDKLEDKLAEKPAEKPAEQPPEAPKPADAPSPATRPAVAGTPATRPTVTVIEVP